MASIFSSTRYRAFGRSLAHLLIVGEPQTAETIGLGDDDKNLWDAVNQDPQKFCKLVTALTTIRLESKEEEFLKASRS